VCCGFPLLGAGFKKRGEAIDRAQCERVKETGARHGGLYLPLVLPHPGMRNTKSRIPLFHATEFVLELIERGEDRNFGRRRLRLTYPRPFATWPCERHLRSSEKDPSVMARREFVD